jgi:thiaminase (transcriptional activator TenA)
MDYGSTFHALLRTEAGAAWPAYVEHPFVRGIEDGTLPRGSFLHYLQQDYVYLIHYTRAWALAAAKSSSVEEMREFAGTALTLIDGEMQLHIETCNAVGISQTKLEATREEPENLAYTRFVMDAGQRGDLLDLLAALIPCALGYGEIGARLIAATEGRRSNHPYRDWIETYGSEDYQGFARAAANRFQRVAERTLGTDFKASPRWPSLSHTFTTACRLETAFWSMGVRGAQHPDFRV